MGTKPQTETIYHNPTKLEQMNGPKQAHIVTNSPVNSASFGKIRQNSDLDGLKDMKKFHTSKDCLTSLVADFKQLSGISLWVSII